MNDNPLTNGRCVRCGRRRPLDALIRSETVATPIGVTTLYSCVDRAECDVTHARNEAVKDEHSRRLDHRR